MHRPTKGQPRPASPDRLLPPRAFTLLLAFALVAVACGTASTPAPVAGPNGVTLVPGAEASATVGSDGGELTAADPERGRSYRLIVPAHAFTEPTEVTLSPIATIDGFPLGGGLLGGAELAPEGAVFLVPVTLEIRLDSDQQAALRSELDEGTTVMGFEYAGDAASAAQDLAITLSEVAADQSTIRLTLFSFSGHGAGTGNPQNATCNQNDPARHAQCEITRILHPPGGPADPTDPAVRGQIGNVLRNWLDVLEVVLDDATDSGAYRSALSEAIGWHWIAGLYDLVSAVWYGPGDELGFEGARLEDAVFRSYAAGLDRANRDCILDQTLEELLQWIDIHEIADFTDIPLPPYSGLAALGPSTFCLQLELTAEGFNPKELAEGASGEFQFRIHDTTGALGRDTQLDKLRAEVVATPVDPARLTASGDRLSLVAYADVTAIQAIEGNDAEGRFDIALRLFGLTTDYAVETATFDITSAGGACSAGSETTKDALVILFDGTSCRIAQYSGVVPQMVIALGLNPGGSGWDDRGVGAAWTREADFGQNVYAGSFRTTFWLPGRKDDPAAIYFVEFDVSFPSAGTMVVSNVRIDHWVD